MSRVIGCKGLHIAEVTKDDVTGTTWETPIAVPSLISLSITDQKENVTFYSDDTVEQVIPAFSGKEISIELGYLNAEIEAMISGNVYEDGIYTQSANATAKEFAILFKAPLSKGGERFVCVYKGVLAKDETGYQGKAESVESSNVTINGIFMPLLSNGEVEIKLDSNDKSLTAEGKALVNTWFTEVPKRPTKTPAKKA